MKLLTASNSDWVLVDKDGKEEDLLRLEALLHQMIGAERLIVLTGLGTSLCIEDSEKNRLAPTMQDLWERAKNRVGDGAWDEALRLAHWTEDFEDDIELLLSRCQMSHALERDESLSTFIENCEEEIAEACDFVTSSTGLQHHESFLRRVARRPSRLPRTQLFTTNYDLAFETAASRSDFTLIDGFSHGGRATFSGTAFDIDLAIRDRERAATAIEWIPNVLHLLKLHGSVNWREDGNQVIRGNGTGRPLIIYPRSTKFEVSYQQPFLELMGRFQSTLRRPDTALMVIGSGLGDRHVLEPILSAVRSNVRLSVVIAAPDLEDCRQEHVKYFKDLIGAGDRRLGLLSAKFDEFVPVLPDLVPESEAERHGSRVGVR